MRTSSHLDPQIRGTSASTPPPTAEHAGEPPGPPGRLFEALSFLKDPLRAIDRVRDDFGDVALAKLGPIRFVFAHDPKDVQHVLISNHRNYIKSRSYEGLRMVMGNGLVTSEGDFWRRQRRLSQPAFHRGRLERLADTMSACVDETVERWSTRANGKTVALDFHAEMMRLTLGIVGQTLFGIDLTAESSTLGPAISVVLAHANKQAESLVRIPLWVPTPSNLSFRKAKRRLDATVHKIITERRAHGRDEGDLLSMLMSVTDDTGEERMTDAQLRDEVMTLFLAGHETIATAMSWTFLLLSQHPDVAARVRAEADAVLGDGPARFADLPRLEYTGWVVNEAMRVYPPVWIIERQALADDVIGGYRIPKGTIVAVSPWGLHKSPKLWKNPERFDPERFSPERSEGRNKYAFLPFGGGPRVCIGNNFALMEAKIIVAGLARRFAVDVVDDPPPVPDPKVTLRPLHGMPARITPR
ncbi:MAG: cytochrome P450 [Myxococcota bacterium]